MVSPLLHTNKKRPLDGPSINNLAMQLRKCCNHPFLLTGVEAEVRAQNPNADVIDSLVKASGKFVLLDKLLPLLKTDGHRILLFRLVPPLHNLFSVDVSVTHPSCHH
jgi:SNF2 family DNA or RNA helicase